QHHWSGVLSSALDAVGHTPLIHLKRIQEAQGLQCRLLGKVEFFSAGGSVKDRIAKRMVEEAEKDGRLIPGKSVIIEPTSGNTGMGLALASALKGYQCIITLPAKMSLEKEVMLRALGAEIVRTPSWDSPESHIGVAHKLRDSMPNAVILDQYSNPNNPLAHYHTTFPEIMASPSFCSDFENKEIDLIVAGAGTGGTITGLSDAIRDREKAFPEKNKTTVVAVDPVGSILGGGEPGNYAVEGIGYDFFPEVLKPDAPSIDDWVKVNDDEAFAMTKLMIRKEALFVGGSSGSALAGALKYLHSPKGQSIASNPNANVIIILPDGVRNYLSKDWFLEGAQGPSNPLREKMREIIGRELGDAYGTRS
ncbi:hypothetical protein TREMEDRAFT_15985, partial [Tremella mesenterica DSM 1558]|uniref:uncharacterized protein n=1 Tax=Tremella mesenterica (strain ATCC 24925 / CBS 8224 / DSM 1558 / NBRC 9311 / NRRL Y-6157 / RJB 2259-6 / UBC 559-6) TaxID=578456 RepID=UPI0003F498FF